MNNDTPLVTDAELQSLYDEAKQSADHELGPVMLRTGMRVIRVIQEVIRLREMESERITALQSDNSRLLNERRMFKAQAHASKVLLEHVLINTPLVARMHAADDGIEATALLPMFKDVEVLHNRMLLLEKDAWTSTSILARDFVQSTEHLLPSESEDADVGELFQFLKNWAERFAKILG